jgi:hypothetical protein
MTIVVFNGRPMLFGGAAWGGRCQRLFGACVFVEFGTAIVRDGTEISERGGSGVVKRPLNGFMDRRGVAAGRLGFANTDDNDIAGRLLRPFQD